MFDEKSKIRLHPRRIWNPQDGKVNNYTRLLRFYRLYRYVDFETELKRDQRQKFPTIDINYIYPEPLRKSLLDIVCTYGGDEFVELLLEHGANPNKINEHYKYAPIHFAAESGRESVISIILQNKKINVNLETLDLRKTALHIAIEKKNFQCIETLLEASANPNIPDLFGTTGLHLAAELLNCKIIELIFKKTKMPLDVDTYTNFQKISTRKLLQDNYPDIKLPSVKKMKINFYILRIYLDRGQEDCFLKNLKEAENLTNNEIDKLIITCAETNMSNAVCELLRLRKMDLQLETIIQQSRIIAIEKSHPDVLKELLKIKVKNKSDDLFLTAANQDLSLIYTGHDAVSLKLECLKIILDQADINVRCQDDLGNTPLHYAGIIGNGEIIERLLEKGSYIGQGNKNGILPIAHISSCQISNYFDKCLQSNNIPTAEHYQITFDYTCLNPYNTDNLTNPSPLREMGVLEFISKNPALKHLLKHPLLRSFLFLKWQQLAPLLRFNFIFYFIFYILINFYILAGNWERQNEIIKTNAFEHSTRVDNNLFEVFFYVKANWFWFPTFLALILLSCREIVQFYSAPFYYVMSSENWLEMIVIVLSAVELYHSEIQIGVIVMLLSAWELVTLIGQSPTMSTNIEMFKTVAKTFIKLLFLYSALILAFSLAFYTLCMDSSNYRKSQDFWDPGYFMFQTFLMFTGIRDGADLPFKYPIFSRIIQSIFVFLMVIVLFNLLNGLAVSDITDILGKAELVSLISRTKRLSHAEKVTVGGYSKSGFDEIFQIPAGRRFNFLGFISRRIFLFPKNLPNKIVTVKPYKNNEIIGSETIGNGTNFISRYMIDEIVDQAKDIITKKNCISESEKLSEQIFKITEKIDNFDTLLRDIKMSLDNHVKV